MWSIRRDNAYIEFTVTEDLGQQRYSKANLLVPIEKHARCREFEQNKKKLIIQRRPHR